MIQRIQTVYLALAILMMVACCCLPLAEFEPVGMGFPAAMYSLVMLNSDGSIMSYLPCVLFAVTLIIELTLIFAIMGYGNRKSQMRKCCVAMTFEVLWLVCYAALSMMLKGDATFHPCFASCLPLIAFVLTILARRGIKKDDELVRSADRIR